LDAAFHRGEFPKGSETARLSDLNALCALFRQPLLLEAADTPVLRYHIHGRDGVAE
jgi:hypothetical protein